MISEAGQDRGVWTIDCYGYPNSDHGGPIFLPRPPITSIEEMGLIPLSEVSDTPPRPVSFSLDARLLAEVMRRIDEVLDEPRGLPNGKGKKRIKLTPDQTHIVKPAL